MGSCGPCPDSRRPAGIPAAVSSPAASIDPETNEPYSIYSTQYRDWAARQDRPVLTSEHAQRVEHIEYGVRTHSEARKLLGDGVAQGVVRCEYRAIPCQSRLDWISADHGPRGLGHLRQPALGGHDVADQRCRPPTGLRARHDLADRGGRPARPHHCRGEPSPPSLAASGLSVGASCRRPARKYEAAMDRFKRCHESNHWPTGYEKLRVLTATGF